jgi:hypothetical protein
MASVLARTASFSEKTGGSLEVRQIDWQGDVLYVIAKAEDDIAGLLQRGDRFVLAKILTTKVRHPVTLLEVRQIGGTLKKSAAFAVTDVLDVEMYGGLVSLARTTDIKGLAGFVVIPAVDSSLVDGIDMRAACNALTRLQSFFVPPKEVNNGN